MTPPHRWSVTASSAANLGSRGRRRAVLSLPKAIGIAALPQFEPFHLELRPSLPLGATPLAAGLHVTGAVPELLGR